MASAPSTQTDEAHADEVAKQAEIAAEVDAAAASETSIVEPDPNPAPTPEEQLVTIRVKEDVEVDYPVAVSVVGSEDLVFTGPSDTTQVTPEVAEQVTYSPVVEVAS